MWVNELYTHSVLQRKRNGIYVFKSTFSQRSWVIPYEHVYLASICNHIIIVHFYNSTHNNDCAKGFFTHKTSSYYRTKGCMTFKRIKSDCPNICMASHAKSMNIVLSYTIYALYTCIWFTEHGSIHFEEALLTLV